MKKFILNFVLGISMISSSYAATTPLESSAKLSAVCTISAENIVFGDVTPANKNEIGMTSTANAIGNLSVLCTKALNYSIALNSGESGNRQLKMSGSSVGIDYTICQTNSFSLGAGTCSSSWKNQSHNMYKSQGTGATQTISMYGFVKKNYYMPGDYSDIVTAVIIY